MVIKNTFCSLNLQKKKLNAIKIINSQNRILTYTLSAMNDIKIHIIDEHKKHNAYDVNKNLIKMFEDEINDDIDYLKILYIEGKQQ